MSENQTNRDAAGPLPSAGADVGPVPSPGAPVTPHNASSPRNAVSGDTAYKPTRPADVGRVPTRGASVSPTNAASGDAAYNATRPADVGRLPTRGVPMSRPNAGSGDPACNPVGRVPSHGVPNPNEPPPRRLRRLHRIWPDRDGNISYLLTPCVDGRARVLDNEITFERFVAFLLDSPKRYRWFGRRFVIMPDHIHLIAHMGNDAVRLGQWIKALKAVVGGLERRSPDAASGDAAYNASDVGRVPSHGASVPSSGVSVPSDGASVPSRGAHEFTRIKRAWRWQEGFHDHKFRTPESEARKWEYVCLNPVRGGLVKRTEEWPFGGEIFYDDAGGPRLVRGTPPLLETGMLIDEKGGTPPHEDSGTAGEDRGTPREGTRPTT